MIPVDLPENGANGNVMIDTLFAQLPKARALDVPGQMGLERKCYAVVTLHRPSNVDDPTALRTVLEALGRVAREMPVVLPIHPRTRKNAENFGLSGLMEPLRVIEPLGYTEMLSLVEGAAIVLTDSGGLQEETTALGVPCITLREQTERPITLTEGTNRLAPWPLTVEGVSQMVAEVLHHSPEVARHRCPRGWDGMAAVRVVAVLSGESASVLGRAG